MNKLNNKKIAIVCDWIKDWGGAELVLAQLMEIFPNADIFTSVFFQKNNSIFSGKKITTSFIQKIPFFGKKHKLALFFRPLAFESFDLSKYDIIISSSSAESKGVITKPDSIHICYCHTPTRYFWSHYHEYINYMEFGILDPIGKLLMPKIVNKLRIWDFVAAQRPDYFIANSNNTSKRIKKYYKRESSIIYPCIDVKNFAFNEKKKDYYLYVGRCIPYKKFDLLVKTFNQNQKKLILLTNTPNKLQKKLAKESKSNIQWKINISNEEKIGLYSNAKAFLFPPEEDFGLVPLEAMACGTPVIAYKKAGALETNIEGITGTFFDTQSIESLNNSINKFETMKFDYKKIRDHALKFDKLVFKKNLIDFINSKI